jgi:hypothetical protein
MPRLHTIRRAVFGRGARLLFICLAAVGLARTSSAADSSVVGRIDALRSRLRADAVHLPAQNVRALSVDPAQWGNWGNWNNWNNWANWANWGNWGNWPNM